MIYKAHTTFFRSEPMSFEVNKKCQICNKPRQSKKSSAVLSCDVCRKKFRRFTTKPWKLTPCVKECVLDWKKRGNCTYCRLKRCLTVGMATGDGFRATKKYTDEEMNDILVNRNVSAVNPWLPQIGPFLVELLGTFSPCSRYAICFELEP